MPTFQKAQAFCTAALLVLVTIGLTHQTAHAQPDNASVDPQAAKAFAASSQFLKDAQAFSFHAHVSQDLVMSYGQKIQLSSERQLLVNRPGQIRGSSDGDLNHVEHWLNDGVVTLLDEQKGVYAQLPTADTIDQTLDILALEHGLVIPLADLVVADPYESAMTNVDAAAYAGIHRVRGVPCHHLVFRQPGMDWQLWIAAQGDPLPQRMVITFTDQPHSPQWMADFDHWNFDPNLADDAFTFTAPANAQQIEFTEFINRDQPATNLPAPQEATP